MFALSLFPFYSKGGRLQLWYKKTQLGDINVSLQQIADGAVFGGIISLWPLFWPWAFLLLRAKQLRKGVSTFKFDTTALHKQSVQVSREIKSGNPNNLISCVSDIKKLGLACTVCYYVMIKITFDINIFNKHLSYYYLCFSGIVWSHVFLEPQNDPSLNLQTPSSWSERPFSRAPQ